MLDSPSHLPLIKTLIREGFGETWMWGYREVFIGRLEHVLGQLDDPQIHRIDIRLSREQYGELKEVLLEVDRIAMETLSRTPLRLILTKPLH